MSQRDDLEVMQQAKVVYRFSNEDLLANRNGTMSDRQAAAFRARSRMAASSLASGGLLLGLAIERYVFGLNFRAVDAPIRTLLLFLVLLAVLGVPLAGFWWSRYGRVARNRSVRSMSGTVSFVENEKHGLELRIADGPTSVRVRIDGRVASVWEGAGSATIYYNKRIPFVLLHSVEIPAYDPLQPARLVPDAVGRPVTDKELATLMRRFEFNEEDLAHNRAGEHSDRQMAFYLGRGKRLQIATLAVAALATTGFALFGILGDPGGSPGGILGAVVLVALMVGGFPYGLWWREFRRPVRQGPKIVTGPVSYLRGLGGSETLRIGTPSKGASI